jgi:hypothetical protein
MSYNANFPASLDSLANPTATTNRDDAGFELHGVISRIQDILEALEAKVGVGASSPGATAAVLRRTATGASAWGQAAPGDLAAAGSPYQVLQTGASAPAAWGKLLPDHVQASGTAYQVLATTTGAGGIAAWSSVISNMIAANNVQASHIYPGGAGNAGTVLRATDGNNSAWGKVQPTEHAAGANNSVLATGAGGAVGWSQAVIAGSYLAAGGQATLQVTMPVVSFNLPSLGSSTLVATNAHFGLVVALEHVTFQGALFLISGPANVASLLAGAATAWDVTPAANNKINMIYTGGGYNLHNGYATAHTVSAILLGV